MDFENQLKLGKGVYTVPEVARILQLPYSKVHTWINKYWDGKLGEEFEDRYSWQTEKSQAVSFHTLVEFYVMLQLAEAGVKTRFVLKAHQELSTWFETAFPFAKKEVLEALNTDGSQVYLQYNNNTITLDGTSQLNLELIKLFFKKLDFDSERIASRLWPMGRDRSIIIDPSRKFGHPIIHRKNIYPETIYNLIKAGDPEEYVAHVYQISLSEIKDALEYCQAA